MKLHRARTFLLLRSLLYLALLVVLCVALRRVAMVFAPVGTGLFVAYLANPLVERLERRNVPRPVGITILILLFAALVTGLGVVLPPLVYEDFEGVSERWKAFESHADFTSVPWLRARLHLPRTAALDEALRRGIAQASDLLRGASGNMATAVLEALQTATGILRLLLTVLLVPVFAIYFLSDYPLLRKNARELIPPRYRRRVLGIVGEINQALASWLRGQLTVMLILGTLYSIGLSLAGIPLGIVIGVTTGLMAFVPYVGVFFGLTLALVVAALDPQPGHAAAGVIATFGAVQALDALIVTPRVLGGQVGLSPVSVILALTLGGELLGYIGLLLAVPSAAVVKVLLHHAHLEYIGSPFYADDSASAAPSAAPMNPVLVEAPPEPAAKSPPIAVKEHA